jgi:hypothetical protein
MQQEPDGPEHQRRRSEFIRKLVQRPLPQQSINDQCSQPPPRTIVQFWHDLSRLPPDVEDCIRSWRVWAASGFEHRLFDERTAGVFISNSLGGRHKRAFERCYHPAMQADYFRLCYLLVEGGFYVDADDVSVGPDVAWLFNDGRLKIQPLCYDIASGTMVNPSVFLRADAYDSNWIFYFNNNPLIANRRNPIIEHALRQATDHLELVADDLLPEIQATTGPGNLSRSIFEFGSTVGDVESDVVVLRDWDSVAVSKWPLSYRDDSRNWRNANQQRFLRSRD